jgi:hypothetical protein
MPGRTRRRLRPGVRLDARWRLLPGDKYRRTPGPMQCNGPTALAGLHSSKRIRIGGTQQHSHCRREDIQFLFGSTCFFLWSLPKMRQKNHHKSEAGRRCACVQKPGKEFSVSKATETGLRVLPYRRRLYAGVTSHCPALQWTSVNPAFANTRNRDTPAPQPARAIDRYGTQESTANVGSRAI